MNLTCYAYKLPFIKPLITSSRSYKNREGWILCWEEINRLYIGEAAPLPGFSQEKMSDIKHAIEELSHDWKKILQAKQPVEQFQEYYQKQPIPPTLQFALDSLSYQIEAYQTQRRVTSLLSNASPASTVPVNGLLSLMNDKTTISDAQVLVDAGFDTVKCKVGQNFSQENKALQEIRKTFPKLNIRLDANQAWTFSEATSYLSELEPLKIQYCEEPLAQPSADHYQTLAKQTSIPLAIDESINQHNEWQPLLPYCSVLVIKPMMIGCFNKLKYIRRQAQEANCKLVLTSSLESSAGRCMVALLASVLGAKNYAHGLNTGRLLLQDTVPGHPTIKNGLIKLDHTLPIIQADPQHLEELSTTIITTS